MSANQDSLFPMDDDTGEIDPAISTHHYHTDDSPENQIEDNVTTSTEEVAVDTRIFELPELSKTTLFGRKKEVISPAREIEIDSKVADRDLKFLLRLRRKLQDHDTRIDYLHRRHWILALKQAALVVLAIVLSLASLVTLLVVLSVPLWVVASVAALVLVIGAAALWFRLLEWKYAYIVITNETIGDFYEPPFPFRGGKTPSVTLNRVIGEESQIITTTSRLLDRAGYSDYGILSVRTADSASETEVHFNRLEYVHDPKRAEHLISENRRAVRY